MYTIKRKIYTTIILGGIASLMGCAGPNYAPVNSRKPTKNSSNYNYNNTNNSNANSNSSYINQPPPPSYSNAAVTSPIGSPSPVVNIEPAPIGYYRVMPSDTLYKIARENNISPKDLIEWNALDNPNNIQPYQLIRISSGTGIKANVINGSNNQSSTNGNINSSNNTTKPTSTNIIHKNTTFINNLDLDYPVRNPSILKQFDGKGIDFAGKLGEPVIAAGDGTVIYAQSMRGYGNLIIIAHALDTVTAYAHLQHINVKEQQKVKKGQNIATIGNTQSDNVKLHFEVRKKSEPVDPIPYLK